MENLAAVVLVLLVLAWVGVCLPAASRARARGPLASTLLFKRGLELIGPDGHSSFVKELGAPPPPNQYSGSMSIRWIPTTLLGLITAGVVATGVAAVLRGGQLWEVHLATDAGLALFVSLLLEEKHRKLDRATKVRSLMASRRVETEPVEDLPLAVGEAE